MKEDNNTLYRKGGFRVAIPTTQHCTHAEGDESWEATHPIQLATNNHKVMALVTEQMNKQKPMKCAQIKRMLVNRGEEREERREFHLEMSR